MTQATDVHEIASPYLGDELQRWRAEVQSFVHRVLVPVSDEVEETGHIPNGALNSLKSMGLYGTNTPREYGGLGHSMLGSCLAIEALGAAHIAFYYTCGVNVHIGSKAIELAGTQAQRSQYLPKIASGEYVAALAMTEPGAGSDAASIQTQARKEGDGFVLDGQKVFITNAEIADCFTVIARTNDRDRRGGLSAFLVPKGAPGLHISPAMDMLAGAGSFHNEVVFKNCRLGADAMIGEEGQGFELAMLSLDHGRTHWAAYSVGLAQALLDLAVKHTNSRVQFGRALSENQAVRWELADIATQVNAARLVAYDAAWRFDRDFEGRRAASAMAKLMNGDLVFAIADRVMQLFGGYAYAKRSPVERMWREARVVQILDGTSQMMRQIIGREAVVGTYSNRQPA
ncbi:MAG: acyl-CoA dehydrogenase family protein [Ramlibacter sp.]|nr:acyl-CoA dehydrogenase family protein [Ramlibacter sp.]